MSDGVPDETPPTRVGPLPLPFPQAYIDAEDRIYLLRAHECSVAIRKRKGWKARAGNSVGFMEDVPLYIGKPILRSFTCNFMF